MEALSCYSASPEDDFVALRALIITEGPVDTIPRSGVQKPT